MVLPLLLGGLGLGSGWMAAASLATQALPYLTGDKKKFDWKDALSIGLGLHGVTKPGAFDASKELTKQGAKGAQSIGTQVGSMLTKEGGEWMLPAQRAQSIAEQVGSIAKPTTPIAKENGFNPIEFIGDWASKDSLIPGTSNFNLAKMGLEAYAPRYQLKQATDACQKSIDAHTKKYKSKADGKVTRSYDTVLNSGACKGLGIAQSKLAESKSKNISNLLKIWSNYDEDSKLSKALRGVE